MINLIWLHNCLVSLHNFKSRLLSCAIHGQNKELRIIFRSNLKKICFHFVSKSTVFLVEKNRNEYLGFTIVFIILKYDCFLVIYIAKTENLEMIFLIISFANLFSFYFPFASLCQQNDKIKPAIIIRLLNCKL